MGEGVPSESGFEDQGDLIAGLPQDWGKTESPLLEDMHRDLCASGFRGKKQ